MARLLQTSRRTGAAWTKQKKKNGSRCTLWLWLAIGLSCSINLIFVLYLQVDLSFLRLPPGASSSLLAWETAPIPESPIIRQPPMPPNSIQNQHQPASGLYHYPAFEKLPTPWKDWSRCDMASTFEQSCHPRPATCRAEIHDIFNNHGIGNALMVSYLKKAEESLAQQPDCAPILHDRMVAGANNNPNTFQFQLLNYVQEPTVVVPIQTIPGYTTSEHDKKCITYSITQPREAVAHQVQAILSQWDHDPTVSAAVSHLPLVALHLRTGWGDELKTNALAWEALGDCRSDFTTTTTTWSLEEWVPRAVNDANLHAVVLDVAQAADAMFGVKQWRLFVASDGPGVRRYVQQMLQHRVAGGLVVGNEGKVGHNYPGGGQRATFEERVEIAVSAFTDVVVMSHADLLVGFASKFPKAANLRTTCPQQFVALGVHPRHGLAKTGGVLTRLLKDKSRQSKDGIWYPQLDDASKDRFWEGLPQGQENPCAQMENPIRSCFCMLKLAHAE